MSRLFVLGGASYIGSHTLQALRTKGLSVIAIDNLSAGRRSLVPKSASFAEGHIANVGLIREVINVVEEIISESLGATFIPRKRKSVATLVTENLKIPKSFPWWPERDNLHKIVPSAIA